MAAVAATYAALPDEPDAPDVVTDLVVPAVRATAPRTGRRTAAVNGSSLTDQLATEKPSGTC